MSVCGWRMTGPGKVPGADHPVVCEQSLRTLSPRQAGFVLGECVIARSGSSGGCVKSWVLMIAAHCG